VNLRKDHYHAIHIKDCTTHVDEDPPRAARPFTRRGAARAYPLLNTHPQTPMSASSTRQL